jgi:hypothetical protein
MSFIDSVRTEQAVHLSRLVERALSPTLPRRRGRERTELAATATLIRKTLPVRAGALELAEQLVAALDGGIEG